VLQFDDGNHGQMTAGRDGSAHNAPFQGQGQHGIGHKDDEKDVPHQVLPIRESYALANESCAARLKKMGKTVLDAQHLRLIPQGTQKGLAILTARAGDA